MLAELLPKTYDSVEYAEREIYSYRVLSFGSKAVTSLNHLYILLPFKSQSALHKVYKAFWDSYIQGFLIPF